MQHSTDELECSPEPLSAWQLSAGTVFSYVTANAVQRDSFLLLLDHTCLKSLSDILGTSQRGPPLSHPVES